MLSVRASAREAAARYQTRVHIPDFLLPDDAKSLFDEVQDFKRWNTVTRSGDKHLDLDAAGLEKLSAADRVRFHDAVNDGARRGFQYLYNNYPIYDAYHAGTIPVGPMRKTFEFLNSAPLLDFVREVTGIDAIEFADAQATRFCAGHFLNEHDDNVDGKRRCAAYVLNLTPSWRADWGGLLMFVGNDGHIEEAYTPKFNALNIFTVPQRHSVSIVAPFAGYNRYSITGWFRAGEDPLRKAAQGKRR